MTMGAIITGVVGLMAIGASAAGYHVYMDARHENADAAKTKHEYLELGQAKNALQIQVVAKEDRLRDIEDQIRAIDERSHKPYTGDARRRADLVGQRLIILERLEVLK